MADCGGYGELLEQRGWVMRGQNLQRIVGQIEMTIREGVKMMIRINKNVSAKKRISTCI